MEIFWYNSHSLHSKARKLLKISAKLESCCSYSQKVKKLLFLSRAWAFPFARRANSHPGDEQKTGTIFQLIEKGNSSFFILFCVTLILKINLHTKMVFYLQSVMNSIFIPLPGWVTRKCEKHRSVFTGPIVANVVGENKEEHNMQCWKCSVTLSSKMGILNP